MKEGHLPIIFKYRVIWHILFWVMVWLTYAITYGGFREHYYEELIINLTLLPVRMTAVYVMIYLLLPLLLDKKQFVLFVILTLFHAVLLGQGVWFTLYHFNLFPDYFDYSKYSEFHMGKIVSGLIGNYVIVFFATTVVIFKKWYLSELAKKNLVKEKMAAELSFLKSQVHPHFLFNTLNNLYALTLIKSEKTSDVVLKLSGLLDYMIYKSNDKFVSLSKELEIMTNYIELEELRYNKRLDLEYKLDGNPGTYKIAPLILLPFIENAFKHGASNDRSSPKIIIKVKIEHNCLILNVVNTILGQKQNDETLSEGIGLKNVRRRLELIYPQMHNLEINESEEQFEVNLKVCWSNE